MFKKVIGLEIESGYAMEFTRLLGELGLEFRFSGEHYYTDSLNPRRKYYYRRWAVRGSKKKIDRLFERLYDNKISFVKW